MSQHNDGSITINVEINSDQFRKTLAVMRRDADVFAKQAEASFKRVVKSTDAIALSTDELVRNAKAVMGQTSGLTETFNRLGDASASVAATHLQTAVSLAA